MTASTLIAGVSAVADRYDVLLCDIWGVIHNGVERFPAACEALVRWRAERGPVILISNAARPSAAIHGQIDQLGVPREAWSAFITSGDATRILLAARAPGPVLAIGSPRQASLYEGLGLAFAGAEDAAFISVTGLQDEENEAPEDYRARLERPITRGLPMICANPDIVVQHGERQIYCAGSLARLYAEMGGEVIMAGKPHAAIYDLCIAEAQAILGRPVDRARVLCIGDSIATDARGANDQRLDVLLVGSGIHRAEALTPEGLDETAVRGLLAQQGVTATWLATALAW